MISVASKVITPEDLYSLSPYALYLTKDLQAAEDLLHDVYLKVYRSQYEEMGTKIAWLRRVIYTVFIDRIREKSKLTVKHNRFKEIIDMCFTPDYESNEVNDIAKKQIAKLLYNLSDRDRTIWQLYLDGFTQQQSAEIMNWSKNNIAAVIHRVKYRILNSVKVQK